METTKKIYIFLIVITVVVVLIYAQSIIIPFVLAILFWFLIRVVKKVLSKIKYIKRLPKWLLSVISSFLLLSFLVFVIEMITRNIQYLSTTLPLYEENIQKITSSINHRYNIDVQNMIKDFAQDVNFGQILSRLFSALTAIFGDAFTVLLYLVFLLLEESTFHKKLQNMYPENRRYERVKQLVVKIDRSISNYIALKTMVSFLTGFLSYFALISIGVDAPLFWAFLIFVLNFIPTIGSLIATFFPAFFAVLQFGEFAPGILVLSIVGAIQLVVGNVVEPRVMGTSLNISPLVVFLTLIMWGVIWGIPGMLLSVPITVILIIIMSQFSATRPIAILLSQRGEISED